MLRLLILGLALGLTACATAPPPPATGGSRAAPLPSPQVAVDNFATVVDRVEPVAEQLCRARAPRAPCDFQIVVDNRPDLPPNAFQTVDRSGRPVVGFTIALIAEARNQSELAFILGHEAAHHIRGHIPRTRESALRGAVLAGVLATLDGADPQAVRSAQDFGAEVGARAYSREFELEADALGALIAYRAGFDPVLGARYFERVEDPDNMFLGTHPPNALRIETVRRVVASID